MFTEETSRRFDLIFSNACLQWLPDQFRTITSLYKLLNVGGIMAVQIPCNFDESMKDEFKKDIMEEIRINYPLQKDGKVIFDFPRLFFTVEK